MKYKSFSLVLSSCLKQLASGIIVKVRYFVAILALALAFPALGGTYYIDYNSGNDSNSGTSTSSPWKRHPFMPGFSGSYSHNAGDQYIFKGGVTWPASCFGMAVNVGGSASAYDYYGVNKSWYSGSSWTRPVFDGGSASSIAIGVYLAMSYSSASSSYITVDNIEFTDYYWGTSAGFGTCEIGVWNNNYVVIQNCYFHGWQHDPSAPDNLNVIQGGTSGMNTGCVVSNCVFDGTASGGNSAEAVTCIPTVKNCIVSNVSNGILPDGSPSEIAWNIIGPINPSYSGTVDHANSIEQLGTSGLIYIHHNIIFGANEICIFVGNPGGPAYIYNNLIYDSNPIPIQADGRNTGANNMWMYNNTIIATATGNATRNVGTAWTLVADNNHLIDSAGVSLGASTTETDDLYETSAQATSAGYVRAKNWQPTSSSEPTVGQGANLTSQNLPGFGVDLLGNPRPATGAWDIGAYQYTSGGGGGGGSVTSNSPPVVSAITQNAADVDPNTTGIQVYEGTTVQYSGTATDPDGNPLTWQWSYTVNGGSSVVFQSGSGTVLPINFTYPTGSASNTYVWTLSASDGTLTSRSQLTVGIESTPVAQAGLSFAATSGIITAPLFSTNGYIMQSVQTGVTNGGVATYTFSITNAGSYVIQALVNAPSDSANSFYVNIDAMPTDPCDTWQIPLTSGFQNLVVSWQGTGTYDAPQFVPEVFTLTSGTHQLYIVGREANTQLQSISILKMVQPPQNLRVLPMIVNAPTFPVTQ